MSNNHEKQLKEQRRREREKAKQSRKQRQIVVISTVLVVVLVIAIVGIVFQNQKDDGQATTNNNGSTGQAAAKIDYNGQPSLGDPNASVKIAEFGDYKCIYCKKFEESIFPKLKKDFIDTGKAQFYFINFTVIDETSQVAANAGEAVFHQDPKAFWDFHEALYAKQGDEQDDWVTKDLLTETAKKAVPSLDVKTFEAALDNQTYQKDVNNDINMARNLGVPSTPALFINGQQVDPFDYNKIKETIREAAQGDKGSHG